MRRYFPSLSALMLIFIGVPSDAASGERTADLGPRNSITRQRQGGMRIGIVCPPDRSLDARDEARWE